MLARNNNEEINLKFYLQGDSLQEKLQKSSGRRKQSCPSRTPLENANLGIDASLPEATSTHIDQNTNNHQWPQVQEKVSFLYNLFFSLLINKIFLGSNTSKKFKYSTERYVLY